MKPFRDACRRIIKEGYYVKTSELKVNGREFIYGQVEARGYNGGIDYLSISWVDGAANTIWPRACVHLLERVDQEEFALHVISRLQT